eukprot:scaffold1_cov375-Pavlova_lutheri.AAC.21
MRTERNDKRLKSNRLFRIRNCCTLLLFVAGPFACASADPSETDVGRAEGTFEHEEEICHTEWKGASTLLNTSVATWMTHLDRFYSSKTEEVVSSYLSNNNSSKPSHLLLQRVHCTKTRYRGRPKHDIDCTRLDQCKRLPFRPALDCLSKLKKDTAGGGNQSPFVSPDAIRIFGKEGKGAPQSVLEFGSNVGKNLQAFYDHGSSLCVGVEPCFMGELAWYTHAWDYIRGPVQFPFSLPKHKDIFLFLKQYVMRSEDKKFSVLLALGSLQSVPRNMHCTTLNFLASQVKDWVVTSSTWPARGTFEANTKRFTIDYGLEWVKRGFRFDESLTMQLMNAFSRPSMYNTPLVFGAPRQFKSVDCVDDEMSWMPYERNYGKKLVAAATMCKSSKNPAGMPIGSSSMSDLYRQFARVNAIFSWENIYLLTTVPASTRRNDVLTAQFLRHYFELGIKPSNILVVVQGDEAEDVSSLAAYLRRQNITYIREWIGPYNSPRRLLEYLYLQVQANVTTAKQWIMLADNDEFHEFKIPVLDLISFLQSRSMNAILSPFADRVARLGLIPDRISTSSALHTQFPFMCPLTRSIGANGWKIVLFQATTRAHNHNILRRRACLMHVSQRSFKLSVRDKKSLCAGMVRRRRDLNIYRDDPSFQTSVVVVHHYKWLGDLTKALSARMNLYKGLGLGWWVESMKILKNINESTRCCLPVDQCVIDPSLC